MEPNGLKMTEIGRRLDLNKSTTYRLLAEMKKRGYVYQEGNRGVYKIGVKFIELVSSYLNNVELKTEAHPLLRRLNSVVDQTVYLAILQSEEVVYIDRIEKYNSFRKYAIIGQRKPLHCTSLGKAMLLSMPDEEIVDLMQRRGMERHTENTMTSPEELLEDIQISRERGWTLDNQEIDPGVRCVGAPVLDYTDRVIAAISVSWFTDCCSHIKEEEISVPVLDTAGKLSRRLGFTHDIVEVLSRPQLARVRHATSIA